MTNNTQPAVPIDPTFRVKALIALTQELAEIFEKENKSLQNRRPDQLAALQEDKARLASAYAQSIRQIAKNRGLVDSAGDTLLSQLKEITQTFEARASKQRSLLDAAQTAGERVLNAVTEEVTKSNNQTTYAADTNTASQNPATPISVNQNI